VVASDATPSQSRFGRWFSRTAEADQAAVPAPAGFWSFAVRPGKADPVVMNDAETKLAVRLRAMLPSEKAKLPVWVHMAVMTPPDIGRGRPHRQPGAAIQITVPIVRGSQLVATFFRPPSPGWPTEVVIAAVMAIVVASAEASVSMSG
jgi:hypothetical protein